jgi:molybdopterin synthase sulfur carrier subunit
MTVDVKFIGSFRSLSGKSRLSLNLGKAVAFREVVRKVVGEVPRLEQALIDPEFESPKMNMLVLVNGKEISVLNGLETVIKDGDEVVFVPVVHGG